MKPRRAGSLRLLRCFLSVAGGLAPALLFAADTGIFRRSHVAAWFDGPDDHRHYDVDVMVQDTDLVPGSDLTEWKAFVDRVHRQGKLFCGELRPLTHLNRMFEWVMTNPEMQAAVCLDVELQPIPMPWFVGHTFRGRTPSFYCSNNPHFRKFLESQVTMFVAIGVDGIMVDDVGGSFLMPGQGGCFCPHCLAGFRQYLRSKYSAAELSQRGIDNPETFDYREGVRRLAPDKAAYREARAQGRIPFSADFAAFLVASDVALFEDLHALARRLSGKHVPMGWDNIDFRGDRSVYYHLWDVFYPEIDYQNYAVDGKGPDDALPPGIVMLNKLADALGKWYTPTPAPRAWGTLRDKRLTGLLQQWIAFTYANGGALRYPRKGWCFSATAPWYYPPKDEFEPIYDFVRRHRELLDGQEAIPQVGVLFTQSRNGGKDAYYSPLKHVCASLVAQNVPFGLIVAGDQSLRPRLDGREAARFEVVLIPEPIRLIDGQDKLVDDWRRSGRAIAIRQGDDVAAKLAGRVQPEVTLENPEGVWLFTRTAPGQTRAPLMCHLVAARYDAKSNRTVPRRNVVVRLNVAPPPAPAPTRAVYHTIGQPPRELALARAGSVCHVTVPEVALWGVLRIER